MLRTAWSELKELLFPLPCVACGLRRKGGEGFLCALCHGNIAWIGAAVCRVCGQPVEIDYEVPEDILECGLCRKSAFRFDRARSLGRYDSVLRKLIHYYKYENQPAALGEIEPLLERFFELETVSYEGFHVAAVPLHVRKLRQRGFDQSYLLARSAAGILGIPFMDDILERCVDTPPQAKKSRKERVISVRGAFRVASPERARSRNFLLVDDVLTTGSTVNEAAKVLKRAGAGTVHVFTLARA